MQNNVQNIYIKNHLGSFGRIDQSFFPSHHTMTTTSSSKRAFGMTNIGCDGIKLF